MKLSTRSSNYRSDNARLSYCPPLPTLPPPHLLPSNPSRITSPAEAYSIPYNTALQFDSLARARSIITTIIDNEKGDLWYLTPGPGRTPPRDRSGRFIRVYVFLYNILNHLDDQLQTCLQPPPEPRP